MGIHNSLVQHMLDVSVSLIRDVAGLHSQGIPCRDLQLVEDRVVKEGIPFLTVVLPSVGKHLDACLSGKRAFQLQGFERRPGSTVPKFLGWLFERVIDLKGNLLLEPDTTAIRQLRQILYLFYKYELPYKPELSKKSDR